MASPSNPADNYLYMYDVTATFTGSGFTFAIDANSQPVAADLDVKHGKKTEVKPGQTVSVTDTDNGLSDKFDYRGTVTFTDSSGQNETGYILYDAATQQFFLASNQQVATAAQSNLPLQSGATADMPLCFMAGTQVSSPFGSTKAEDLKPGDLVLTSDGRLVAVRWVGRQTVMKLFANEVALPVRIKAGALAENVPVRDLLVSHDHAIFLDGILVHAGALINGTSVVRETNVPNKFVYYHIEVDDHSLILAENTPAETFIDNIDRAHFDNWDEYQALYPSGKSIEEMPYARAKARRQVPRKLRDLIDARARLLALAAEAAA
jgi:hypothetical protein